MGKISHVKMHLDQQGNIRTNLIDDTILNVYREEDFVPLKSNGHLPLLKKHDVDISELETYIEYLEELYTNCNICISYCGVNRVKGESGKCGLDARGYIYMALLLKGEEEMISPSYAIYLSGCNISCTYCHQKNLYPLNNNKPYISHQDIIADIIKCKDNINTISFLGGNPDQSLLSVLFLIKELELCKFTMPYVLNSNFLFMPAIIPILNKYFDVFLPDFKFGNDNCAYTIANENNYVEIVMHNILSVCSENPVIIRHLPMNGHWECCTKPIIDWLASLHEKDKYYLTIQDSLYNDNSVVKNKCLDYAIENNLMVIY